MQITLNTVQELLTVLQDKQNLHLPIRLSYKLVQLSDALQKPFQFYTDQIRILIKDYAEFDEEGHVVMIPETGDVKLRPECREEGQKKFRELQDVTTEIADHLTFTLDELESLDMTPRQLALFMPLIQED